MSSSKKTTSSFTNLPGFGFPLPAAVALDIPRFQNIWRAWYEAGIVDRPWDLGVYLELLHHFVHQGLIDWSGMGEMKSKVVEVLDRVRTGVMTLEEFQAGFDRF